MHMAFALSSSEADGSQCGRLLILKALIQPGEHPLRVLGSLQNQPDSLMVNQLFAL